MPKLQFYEINIQQKSDAIKNMSKFRVQLLLRKKKLLWLCKILYYYRDCLERRNKYGYQKHMTMLVFHI